MVHSCFPRRRQNGFALIVGVLLLLVLTLLSLTAIRGTQLELQMATAVTRQEQAIEASDAARAMGRELMSRTILQTPAFSNRFVAPTDGDAVPTFATEASNANCPADVDVGQGTAGTYGGASAAFIRGVACFDTAACMNIRLQQVNTSPDQIPVNFARSFPLAPSLCAQAAFTSVQLTTRNEVGRDATADELKAMFGIVARGNAPDGASSKTVALVSLRTPR
jgi:Tfp pilus assembly protein PilX